MIILEPAQSGGLQVMLDHGDLAQVLLQLCATDGECKMEYGSDASGQPSTSAAKAIAKTGKLPLLPEPVTAHWRIRDPSLDDTPTDLSNACDLTPLASDTRFLR